MMQKLTDMHCHILHGIDDGAQSMEEMYAMLRKAAEQGIGRIVATPHATPGIERFNREKYDRALEDARAYCAEKRLDIEIFGGAEILYTDQTCRFLEDGRIPTMAGTDYVLVEFSPDVRYGSLHGALTNPLHSGYLPIVAHVERYNCLLKHPARLNEIKHELGVYYQVNCSSIIRGHDMRTRHFVNKILDWDLLDIISTDAHRAASVRVINMREAWLTLKHEFGEDYANELADGHLLFGANEENTEDAE